MTARQAIASIITLAAYAVLIYLYMKTRHM